MRQSGDVFISHDAFQKARNMRHAFGRGHSELCGTSTDRIGKLRPGGDSTLANAYQRQCRLLLGALYRNEPHRRAAHRLAKRFSIGRIILAALYVGLCKLRRISFTSWPNPSSSRAR
ncbi:hypothetical protein SCH4B_0267 [Ruegeria sp. TrichCH4B]|nr:hypothetical protein SCH4B_0267 [Ruegeria sp. TrichCH4B]